jgi:hypothetical protein
MAALDIRPHSRRLSALAVAGLAVLAIGGFTAGLGRQVASSMGPSPFPPKQEPSLRIQVAGGAPMAAAQAPLLQRTPRPAPAEQAEAPPAVDVSAVVADPSPAPEPTAPPAAEPQPATDADPPTL